MEDKLKILMTADTVGGVWKYAADLCAALAVYQVEIHLVTMGGWLTGSQKMQIQALEHVTVYESNLKLEWMPDPWEDLKLAGDWINEIYKEVQPDIMHLNNYAEILPEWQCGIITVFHSCVATWYQAVKGEKLPREWQRYKERVSRSLSLSDRVVFPSAGIRTMASKEYRNIACSEMIYNGCNQTGMNVQDVKLPVILSAGRLWDEAKNIRLLCEIAPRLSWQVQVAGNETGPDKEAFASKHVTMLGQLSESELYSEMQKASIFVMPATYEPFGLAVLEAACCGCALVLSNIATLKEIWGDAALYFDAADKTHAQQVIQRLMDDPVLRQDLADKAKKRAAYFNINNMAEKYWRLYQELISEKTILSTYSESV